MPKDWSGTNGIPSCAPRERCDECLYLLHACVCGTSGNEEHDRGDNAERQEEIDFWESEQRRTKLNKLS